MKDTAKKILISIFAVSIISLLFTSSSLAARTSFDASTLSAPNGIKILSLDSPNEFAAQPILTSSPDSLENFSADFTDPYVDLKWDAKNNASGYYIYRASDFDGYYEKIARVQCNCYIDISVIAFNTYYYKIAPYFMANEQEIIGEMSVYKKVITGINAPYITSLTNISLKSIKIKWSPVKNAESYYIYRSSSENGSYKKIALTEKTYFTDTSLARHTTYYYKIRAHGYDAISAFSSSKHMQTRLATPIVTSTRTGYHTINISWNKISHASGYYLYRARTINGSYTKIAALKTYSYKDTHLNTGNTYYYKVKAYYSGSSDDNSICGKSEGVQLYLSRPSNISAKVSATSCVKISWSAVKNANYYFIYRSQSENGPYIISAGSRSCSYTDTNLQLGQIYYYKISALKNITDVKYESAKTASISIKATLSAPKITVSYFSSSKQAVISWNAVSEASQYRVYRKTPGGSYCLLTITNQFSFTDHSGIDGELYYYRVRACCDVDGLTIYGLYCAGVKTVWSDIDISKPMIALTFDDGPSCYTYIILNQLEKYHAHATFFVVGSRVKKYSNIINRAHSLGCEIGNHTYSHPSLPSLSTSSVKSQISKTDTAIKNLIGHAPKLFRPPYGSYNSRVADNAGKPLILWSIDTRDWQTHSKSATVSKVLSSVKDGDIILMHDLYLPTCRAAKELIPKLKAKGYQLVTVSELAKYKGYKLKNGSSYHRFR